MRTVILIVALSLLGISAYGQVASVQVGSTSPVNYTDFDAAWSDAMSKQSATITLLDDITRTTRIVYQPKVANGRHTLDLNNHTITENTDGRLLTIYKADAKLTITDNSLLKSGCLYKKQLCDTTIYTVVVDRGELEIAGGKIYCENTKDDGEWHPAVGIYSSRGNGAKVTISGGLVECKAYTAAYAVSSYGKLRMTDGTLRATNTKYKTKNSGARALTQYLDTADISGGTLEAFSKDSSALAYTVVASSWISSSSGQFINGVVNITSGTFIAQSDSGSINVLRADAKTAIVGGDTVLSHGTFNISGGTFTARCTHPLVKQVFCGFVSGDRLFDEATPHNLLGESMGEMNISGGTFLVDTRDGVSYCGEGDVDLFRCWGTLNISGGNFTLYTKEGAGLGVYRGKAVLSGNPVFTIHAEQNARGLIASPWNSSSYCDADASKNLSEIEVKGGTYIVDNLTENGMAYGIWASGGISSASSTVDPGYAMSAKITVTGGEVITIHPKADNSRPIRQNAPKKGIYGTANADMIIRGGKFKAMTGTFASNEPTGKNIDPNPAVELTSLARGYFATYSELAMHTDDTCTIVPIEDTNPEYSNGYRYKIATGPVVAQTTVGAETKSFSMLQSAMRYAFKYPSALVTLTDNDVFWGPFTITPKIANCHVTIDVNNHTVTGVTLNDRFLVTNNAGLKLTFTDNSVSKNGAWEFSSDIKNTLYGLMALVGEIELKGGRLHVVNNRSGYTASAFYARTNGKVSVYDGFHIQALRGVQLDGDTKGVTIYGGKFECTNNIHIVSGTPTNLNVRGGYYKDDSKLEATVKIPYWYRSTTDAEKAIVGNIYKYRVEPIPESGPYADIIDVDNTNHKVLLNVSSWPADGWPYLINKTSYAKSLRKTDRTLEVPYTGNPGDDLYLFVQKSNTDVLCFHPYLVPEEVTGLQTLTADVDHPLYVKGTTLTINGNVTTQNIYVDSTSTLRISNGSTLTADTIFLRTAASTAAELINNGTIAASTKVYYTRIVKSNAGYCQFGLPLTCLETNNTVRLSNGMSPGYRTGSGWVLRQYDEASRATNGIQGDGAHWRTPESTDFIQSGTGYEIYSGVNYYREFYFPVDITTPPTSVAVTHTDGNPRDAGWNVIVSPLTHTIANSPEPEGLVVSWMMPDGSFEQEIPSSIPPVKVFAYQAASTGVLSFDGSSVSHPAPRRMTAAEEQNRIQWIHLDITNANGEGDQTSIYSHPTRYEQSYQTGIDVAKQSLTSPRARIYSSHTYGDMAFAGVSDALLEQGVALTVYNPSAQELTISMRRNDWLNRMEHVWLIDHAAGTCTDLLAGDYSFDAVAGTTAGRFTVQGQFRAPQDTNGMETASDASKAYKVIINGRMYIRLNGMLYDATGLLVERY